LPLFAGQAAGLSSRLEDGPRPSAVDPIGNRVPYAPGPGNPDAWPPDPSPTPIADPNSQEPQRAQAQRSRNRVSRFCVTPRAVMPYAVTLLRPRVSATLAFAFRNLEALSGTDLPDNPARQVPSSAYKSRPRRGLPRPAYRRHPATGVGPYRPSAPPGSRPVGSTEPGVIGDRTGLPKPLPARDGDHLGLRETQSSRTNAIPQEPGSSLKQPSQGSSAGASRRDGRPKPRVGFWSTRRGCPAGRPKLPCLRTRAGFNGPPAHPTPQQHSVALPEP
jgi:hypothetical protein